MSSPGRSFEEGQPVAQPLDRALRGIEDGGWGIAVLIGAALFAGGALYKAREDEH